jgi:excisionase family DNA binding protein
MPAAEPRHPNPTRRPPQAKGRVGPPSLEGDQRSPSGRSTPTGGSLPTLIDIPTAAEHLGTTPRHIRRLVAERRIPYVKLGHYIRFEPAELAAWLDQHRRQTMGPAWPLS